MKKPRLQPTGPKPPPVRKWSRQISLAYRDVYEALTLMEQGLHSVILCQSAQMTKTTAERAATALESAVRHLRG